VGGEILELGEKSNVLRYATAKGRKDDDDDDERAFLAIIKGGRIDTDIDVDA